MLFRGIAAISQAIGPLCGQGALPGEVLYYNGKKTVSGNMFSASGLRGWGKAVCEMSFWGGQ
jgi:hypothetical protein